MFILSLVASALALSTPSPQIVASLRSGISNFLAGSNDIAYTIGAPVLTGDVNIYLIYYGSWTDSQKSTVEYFVNNIGASPWYNIERKYYSQATATSNKVYVNGAVKVAGTVTDTGSVGNAISGNMIPNVIQGLIDSKALPEDTSAIYFFLTSGGISESIRPDLGTASFCNDYCGYHVSWPLTSGTRIYYAFAGLPTACISGCAPPENQSASPNGDVSVDGMLSVFAHELVEAVSDPWSDGTRAWSDSTGYENGDKCAWTFGAETVGSSGSYNMVLGSKQFLIQQNWDPATQACGMSA